MMQTPTSPAQLRCCRSLLAAPTTHNSALSYLTEPLLPTTPCTITLKELSARESPHLASLVRANPTRSSDVGRAAAAIARPGQSWTYTLMVK